MRENFKNPDARYRGKPFWSWNGELKKEEIIRQIRLMKNMGLGGYFMHSRSGLITEYLGKEWFELINAGADEGADIGMEAWLYDEDRWPSGSAGGMVTLEEKYRMKSIRLMEVVPQEYTPDGKELLVFLANIEDVNVHAYQKIADVSEWVQVLSELKDYYLDLPGEWKLLVFSIVEKECTSEFNGTTYLDTMNPEATQHFIALTHEKYVQHCGDRIGQSVKGIFTDEPHRGCGMGDYKEVDGSISCSMAWTDDMFEEFEKRYGYDAREVLPELFYRLKGERFAPIKHDYFDLANNLFLERFAQPILKWCKEHNLLLTGHALHEDSLTCQAAPHGSLMRYYEFLDYPGIDVLGSKNTCYWIAKQVVSVARQLGKTWCLSEMYGCSGWEYSMKGQKMTGDWQALLGINLRCQHLSWYTMEGEAKRDFPGSMLHQAPWHPYYDGVESYFSRFGLFMSEGTPQCDVLVLNPIESAWSQAYAGWADWIFCNSKEVAELEEKYRNLCLFLLQNHIDFDYGEEQMMERLCKIETDVCGKPVLVVGQMSYHVVIVGGVETIRPSTLQLLEEFIDYGGKVIFAGDAPAYVDARPSKAPSKLAGKALCVPFEEAQIVSAVHKASEFYANVLYADGSIAKDVFLQMRAWKDGTGFVALNCSETEEKEVQVVCAGNENMHLEFWDFETGERFCADEQMNMAGDRCYISVTIPPAGTKAYVLTETEDQTLLPTPKEKTIVGEIELCGEYEYALQEQNVCVLDKASWRIAGKEWSEPGEVLRVDRQIRAHFGIEYRSGEMLQPWYARKYANEVYDVVELKYKFVVDELPESGIYLVGERPEKMNYALNGEILVCHDAVDFWIDDCFKKMWISKDRLRLGENVITLRTDFSRLTNIEALYLVGDFGVRIGAEWNQLTHLSEKIGGENLSSYGLPFYTGEITYYISAEMYKNVCTPVETQIYLTMKSPYASLYKVACCGEEKVVYWDPYQVDVTEAIAKGEPLEVTVVPSRRNTFGPLHLRPTVCGSYSPHSYVTEGESWSDSYELLDNGLTIYFTYKK